jgi:hypothetical protein
MPLTLLALAAVSVVTVVAVVVGGGGGDDFVLLDHFFLAVSDLAHPVSPSASPWFVTASSRAGRFGVTGDAAAFSSWLWSASSARFDDRDSEKKNLRPFPELLESHFWSDASAGVGGSAGRGSGPGVGSGSAAAGSSAAITFSTTTSSMSCFDFFRLKMELIADSMVNGGLRGFGGDSSSGTDSFRTRRRRSLEPTLLDLGRSSFALVPSSDSPASAPEEAPDCDLKIYKIL